MATPSRSPLRNDGLLEAQLARSCCVHGADARCRAHSRKSGRQRTPSIGASVRARAPRPLRPLTSSARTSEACNVRRSIKASAGRGHDVHTRNQGVNKVATPSSSRASTLQASRFCRLRRGGGCIHWGAAADIFVSNACALEVLFTVAPNTSTTQCPHNAWAQALVRVWARVRAGAAQ